MCVHLISDPGKKTLCMSSSIYAKYYNLKESHNVTHTQRYLQVCDIQNQWDLKVHSTKKHEPLSDTKISHWLEMNTGLVVFA